MKDASRVLLEEASRGDARAVDALLEKHLSGLQAYVRLRAGKLIRAKESSMDIVQSVCREVLEHADRYQYQGEANFRNWLFTTALRKICNRAEHYQAGKRDVRKEENFDELLHAYRSFYTPSRVAMAKEELNLVEGVFEELPEDYREVIVLSRVVGFSHAEIAKQLNRSEGAVRVLLHRALAEVAERMETE